MKSLFSSASSLIVTVVSVILIIFIALSSNTLGQLEIGIGDVSPEDVYAPRAIVDEITTNAAKNAARESVQKVYIANEDKKLAAVKTVEDIFSCASTIRSDEEDGFSLSAKAGQLSAKVKIDLSMESALTLVSESEKQFNKMRNLSSILNEIMSEGVGDVKKAETDAFSKLKSLSLTDRGINACREIFSSVVTVNLELDEAETLRRSNAAADAIPAIEYKKNQIILRKGEIVSEAQLSMLEKLGLIKGSTPLLPTYTAGIVLFFLICLILLGLHLSNEKANGQNIMIISSVALVSVIIAFFGGKFVPDAMIYLLPVSLFVCISTVFCGTRATGISNIVLCFLYGIAFDYDWSYSICMIIGGLVCAYAFSKVKRRNHLFPATIISSLMYAFLFFSMTLITTNGVKMALLTFIYALLGNLLSGILSIGLLPFLEWLFNATTPMKLTELANPENKLLKKLLIEAPGTYHHSLTVANISEIAAREVNANPLLARVGAYYHDIGKLRNPLYFKENQYDINPHDNLSPEKSAKIIISHVSDGVETAKKYRLPQNICDIISEHHGSTTAGYFLKRWKEQGNEDESAFTYPCPTPKSKESAIVMLVDSCEAAVRSITDKNPEKIEEMVRRIASDRVNSGQFSKCNLTFTELETIIRVIIKTLGGYFHERVKYE